MKEKIYPSDMLKLDVDKNHKIDDLIAYLEQAKEEGCEKIRINAGGYGDAITIIDIVPYGYKKEVKINKTLKSIRVPLYDNEDREIGYVENELQFNDVRIQAAKYNLKGYYFMFEGKKIEILLDGGLSSWPDGFFDQIDDQLEKLVDF